MKLQQQERNASVTFEGPDDLLAVVIACGEQKHNVSVTERDQLIAVGNVALAAELQADQRLTLHGELALTAMSALNRWQRSALTDDDSAVFGQLQKHARVIVRAYDGERADAGQS